MIWEAIDTSNHRKRSTPRKVHLILKLLCFPFTPIEFGTAQDANRWLAIWSCSFVGRNKKEKKKQKIKHWHGLFVVTILR